MPSLGQRISQCALSKFKALPNKGKPSATEWGVISAIVAEEPDGSLWVVSMATGNKCIGPDAICGGGGVGGACKSLGFRGYALHDSHAEVLARRGFLYVLWKEMNECTVDEIALNQGVDYSGENGIAAESSTLNNSSKGQISIEHSSSSAVNNTSINSTGVSSEKSESMNKQKPSSSSPSSTKKTLLSRSSSCLPPSPNTTFHLREGVNLHLFITESPCGDATIYELNNEKGSGRKEGELKFTGAKAIHNKTNEDNNKNNNENDKNSSISSTASAPTIIQTNSESLTLLRETEPNSQALSALRLKSGRADISPGQRSLSHSCSDKIVRWSVLGLQGNGGGIRNFIPQPITLKSVVVQFDVSAKGEEDQRLALERAITMRAQNCYSNQSNRQPPPPEANVVIPHPLIFENYRCPERKSPCGMSVNYNFWDDGAGKGGQTFVEVTVGATGLKQMPKNGGKKKEKRRDLRGEQQQQQQNCENRNKRAKIDESLPLQQQNKQPEDSLSSSFTSLQPVRTTPPPLADPTAPFCSRLCRRKILSSRVQLMSTLNKPKIDSKTYQQMKRVGSIAYNEERDRVLADKGTRPLCGWIRSSEAFDFSDK